LAKKKKKEKKKATAGKKGEDGGTQSQCKKGKSLDEMMAYVDENGNISATPPDPRKRKYSSWKIWKPVHRSMCLAKPLTHKIRSGDFFNDAKGFGFIKDLQTQESVFIHVNQLQSALRKMIR